MFLTKTYSIRDGIYYNSNAISSSQSLSIANIPTNFKLLFKVNTKSSSTSNSAYLKLGSNANNCIFIGQLGDNGASGIWVRVNGTNVVQNHSVILPVGENLIEYSYDNGVQTFKHETDSITVNNSQITSRSYLESFITNNYVKELLILPL